MSKMYGVFNECLREFKVTKGKVYKIVSVEHIYKRSTTYYTIINDIGKEVAFSHVWFDELELNNEELEWCELLYG